MQSSSLNAVVKTCDMPDEMLRGPRATASSDAHVHGRHTGVLLRVFLADVLDLTQEGLNRYNTEKEVRTLLSVAHPSLPPGSAT